MMPLPVPNSALNPFWVFPVFDRNLNQTLVPVCCNVTPLSCVLQYPWTYVLFSSKKRKEREEKRKKMPK